MNLIIRGFVFILYIVKYVDPFALSPRSVDSNLTSGICASNYPVTLNYNKYYYERDGHRIRLPNFRRQRARKVRILDEAFSITPIPLEELLHRTKTVALDNQFDSVEQTFLQIFRYMNLEKDMFLNHELFPEIRFYALKNKSLFGRVYSNELSRMFRARNSFINQDFFKHIDIYLSLETFNYDIESLPRFLESLDCPSDIPSSFFKRLDDLCRSSGRIRAINSTFEGITPKFSCDSISSKFPRLIVSVWGAIAYNTIMNGDNYLKATINNICEVKTIDMKDPSFEILKLKYNEDNLTYCNRMTTTVFNLFEQLYKLYKLIDDSPSVCDEDIDSKVSEADNLYSKILLPTDKTNFDELVALYHYSKQQILGNNDTQGLLAGFTEAIEYLNTKMQEHTFDRKNLKSFISLVCKPYMQSIMDFWSHNDEVYHKLDAIYKGVSESTGEYFQCFLPKSIIGTMYDCGLKNLCNIFDYKPEPQRDQTYCIMRGRNFSFLFDPDSGKILRSKFIYEMDLWNCGTSVNFPPNINCHIVFSSHSRDIPKLDEIVKRVKCSITQHFSFPIIDKYMTLNLPKCKVEGKKFDINDEDTDFFIHPSAKWLILARLDCDADELDSREI